MNSPRISIDGPTAAGKTTLGLWLADELSTIFIDTGLTYRGLALLVAELHRQPSPDEARTLLSRITHQPHDATHDRAEEIFIDNTPVTDLIWSETCNGVLPWLSEDVAIRQALLEFHINLVKSRGCVVAGRDIAMTLLPDASFHIYLTARYEVRRQRRRSQVAAGRLGTPIVGASQPLDAISRAYVESRPHSVIFDTSKLTSGELCDLVWEAMAL